MLQAGSGSRYVVDKCCREVDHKRAKLRKEMEAIEAERHQLLQERGLWAEQRGAALAAAEQATSLQRALASHVKDMPGLKVGIRHSYFAP